MLNLYKYYMIDQAKQQIYRTNEIQQQAKAIHYLNVGLESQERINDIFKSSSRQLRQIQSKLEYQIKRDFFMTDIMNKISSFRFVDNPTLTQYKPEQITDLSIMPLMADLVISHLQNLLQIELQIDPFTKQLIKMPDQKLTVLQFVTDLVGLPLIKQFDMIDKQYCAKKLFFSQRRDLWRPVFKQMYRNLSKVNFMISEDNAFKMLFNKKIKLPIRENDIVMANNAAFEKYEANNDADQTQYEYFMNKLIVDEILKKRDVKIKQPARFFSIIAQPTNYEMMLLKSLHNQSDLLNRRWEKAKQDKGTHDLNRKMEKARKQIVMKSQIQ